jgi:phosphoribosylamine-glycine ligase
VVLASKGYPEKAESGKEVLFLPLPADMVCFHAGTKADGKKILTAGGRVFGLTATANDISSAIDTVYANVKSVSFEGMQHRKDIAYRALEGAK